MLLWLQTKLLLLLFNSISKQIRRGFFFFLLTLSAMGGAGPSIAWGGGGQFNPHLLTAPRGLFGHYTFNLNHYIVERINDYIKKMEMGLYIAIFVSHKFF